MSVPSVKSQSARPTTTKPAGGKKKLTVRQRRHRQNQQPVTPGSAMTLGQALQQARSAARLQYQPQLAQITQAQHNASAWFPAYQQELTQLNNAQQARYSAAVQQVQQAAAQAQQQQSQSNQALQSQLQQQAAQRGATYSGTPTAQSQAATNQQQNLANALAGAIAAQGTAYSGYTSQQAGVGAAAQLGARQQLASERQQVKGQMGAARANTLGSIRSDEAKNVEAMTIAGLSQQGQNYRTKVTTRAEARRARLSAKTSTRNNQRTTQTSLQNTKVRTAAQEQARQQAAQAKRQAAHQKVQQGSHKEKQRLLDIGGLWDHFKSGHVVLTGPRGNPVIRNGVKQTRPPSDSEVMDAILKKGYTISEINIARKIHSGQRLNSHEVHVAKGLGWIVGKKYHPIKQPKPQVAHPGFGSDTATG